MYLVQYCTLYNLEYCMTTNKYSVDENREKEIEREREIEK